MQPYFFPYLGYFSLIKHTDNWIVFDTAQYIRQGWVNRNRILHPNEPKPTFVTIPVNLPHWSTAICEVPIDNSKPHREKILRRVDASYRGRAPHFDAVMDLLSACLQKDWQYISQLNTYCLEQTCQYLSLQFNYELFSEMDITIDDVSHPGEWALNISKALRATEYINPPGGQGLFDAAQFKQAGINLSFLKNTLPAYNQRQQDFVNGLSILDVMMFNDIISVQQMLDAVITIYPVDNHANSFQER